MRDTDSLLERDGFELPVPRHDSPGFSDALRLIPLTFGPLPRWRRRLSWAAICFSVPCASSSSGPLCGSQEEPPVWPPRRRRVGPARGVPPLEPPPRLCGLPRGLQPRQLPRPLALRLRALSLRV